MDASTSTLDSSRRPCCYCAPSRTRCRTDYCLCYKNGRQCQNRCESGVCADDCLNKPVIGCKCLAEFNMAMASESLSESNFCRGTVCNCFRFGEKCSEQCSCAGICANDRQPPYDSLDDRPTPPAGCQCHARGGGCKKFKKCTCLQSLGYCRPSCKCRGECCNRKYHFELSKSAKNCFFDPEHYASGTTAVLRVTSANAEFQLEITPNDDSLHAEQLTQLALTRALSNYNVQIQHLLVYTPRSPCFHQDCRCDIVDHCRRGKSCARDLSVLYKQLRRLTQNANLEMTVRFLAPYVARGDLYTKQAIGALLEAGIRVEPINMKEWAELIGPSERRLQSNVSQEPPTASAYYKFWNVAGMDRYVRLSQQYINHCRRSLNIGECFWISPLHDLLRSTVNACAEANDRFQQVAVRFRPPPPPPPPPPLISRNSRKSRVEPALHLEHSEEKKHSFLSSKFLSRSGRSRHSSASGSLGRRTPKFRFNWSKSMDDLDRQTQAFTTVNGVLRRSESGHVTIHREDTGPNRLVSSSFASYGEKIIRNLSARSITEAEQREIQKEVASALDVIQQRLTALLQYLDQRIASVPV